MSWQQTFLEKFGTGGLGGMSLSTWWRSLADNQFSVDAPYLRRALLTTLSCLQNSVYRRIENWRFGRDIESASMHTPLFVLGLWRSGTTHLHNLLAQDERFAFPNTYQVFFPHTFLTTESWNAGLLDFLLPAHRIQDNVRLGADQPQEDEFALAGLTGISFMMSMAFPRRAEAYSRYLTFEGTTLADQNRWGEGLLWFMKKLTVKYDRPLVLKTPAHTGHVRELLALLPDAKFVLIHRDPNEVFASTLHTFDKVFEMWALQRLGSHDIVESTIHNYRAVTEKYFRERTLIPRGNLVEIAYADLEQAPLNTLRRIYSELNLPDFGIVAAKMQDYLDSLGTYRKNDHAPLRPDLQHRLAHEWRSYFSTWGYEQDGQPRKAA